MMYNGAGGGGGMGGGLMNSWGQLTDEERQYILQNMPDFGGMENDMDYQRLQAEALRPKDRGRMDWASQASRALQGFQSGDLMRQAKEGGLTRAGTARTFFGGLANARRPRIEEMLPGQFSTVNSQYG